MAAPSLALPLAVGAVFVQHRALFVVQHGADLVTAAAVLAYFTNLLHLCFAQAQGLLHPGRPLLPGWAVLSLAVTFAIWLLCRLGPGSGREKSQ